MKDAGDPEALYRLGIDHVLNVTTHTAANSSTASAPARSARIRYKQLHAADNGYQNLKQYFDEAFEFIDSARRAGGAVLIHCQAGVSRSPTIALAYLIKHCPMSMVDAYRYVKSRRSIISPNLNFMGQLLEFEQALKQQQKEQEKGGAAADNTKSSGVAAAATINSASKFNSANNNMSDAKEKLNCASFTSPETSPPSLPPAAPTVASPSPNGCCSYQARTATLLASGATAKHRRPTGLSLANGYSSRLLSDLGSPSTAGGGGSASSSSVGNGGGASAKDGCDV